MDDTKLTYYKDEKQMRQGIYRGECFVRTALKVVASLQASNHHTSHTLTGQVPLSQVLEIEFLPQRRKGARLDVRKDQRTYALDAKTPREAQRWTRVLQKTWNNYKALRGGDPGAEIPRKSAASGGDEEKTESGDGSATVAVAVDISPLQKDFLEARYGPDAVRIRTAPRHQLQSREGGSGLPLLRSLVGSLHS